MCCICSSTLSENNRLDTQKERMTFELQPAIELQPFIVWTFPASGVATGWHGWTMSRGPGAKGPPREREKKERKKRKEKKEKEKRKRKKEKKKKKNFSKRTGAPPDISPWVLEVDRKFDSTEDPISKSKIGIIINITQSLKYETNNGELGAMYFLSACMTSKISQLKCGTHKLGRVQWSRINPFEKNLWSWAPNFPIRSPWAPPNFPIATSTAWSTKGLSGFCPFWEKHVWKLETLCKAMGDLKFKCNFHYQKIMLA